MLLIVKFFSLASTLWFQQYYKLIKFGNPLHTVSIDKTHTKKIQYYFFPPLSMSGSLNESPENAELAAPTRTSSIARFSRELSGPLRQTACTVASHDAADLRCQLIQSLSDSQATHFLTQTHSSLSQRWCLMRKQNIHTLLHANRGKPLW